MTDPPPASGTSHPAADTALRVVAWVMGAIDVVALAWWVALGARVGPTFGSMFADLGGEVPLPTRVVIHPAFGFAVAAVGAGALAGTVFAPLRPVIRAGLLGALLVAHFAASGVTAYVLYLPIFTMADKVH